MSCYIWWGWNYFFWLCECRVFFVINLVLLSRYYQDVGQIGEGVLEMCSNLIVEVYLCLEVLDIDRLD